MVDSRVTNKELHARFDRFEDRIVSAITKNGDAISKVREELSAISNQVQTNTKNIEKLDTKVDSTRKWNAADSTIGMVIAGVLAIFK